MITGQQKVQDRYVYLTKGGVSLQSQGNIILGEGMAYISSEKKVFYQAQNDYIDIKKIITLSYKNTQLNMQVFNTGHRDGYTMIHLVDKRILIVDDKALNSTLIKMGVLGFYNKKLFEPVILSKDVKVYRVL